MTDELKKNNKMFCKTSWKKKGTIFVYYTM